MIEAEYLNIAFTIVVDIGVPMVALELVGRTTYLTALGGEMSLDPFSDLPDLSSPYWSHFIVS